MEQTVVYDSYWRFAAERHRMYLRRLANPVGPFTDDPYLSSYRFTNSFRVADRVSQYLVSDVQYRSDRSQAPSELFFRTLLFKIFNRIETWELIEAAVGSVAWQSIDLDQVSAVLDGAMRRGTPIYSAAYIMPAPRFGRVRKHANHLRLLETMMEGGLPGQIERAPSLSAVYDLLRPWPGIGDFLAFQYAIDLNYSNMISFDEGDFVVAGPGAVDGISKVFNSTGDRNAREVIHHMVDIQESEFIRLGIDFPGLFGRRLQPIDCQNLFCEIGKYARVAHPEVTGKSGRTRIKQGYGGEGPLPQPRFPPRWNLEVPTFDAPAYVPAQGSLL